MIRSDPPAYLTDVGDGDGFLEAEYFIRDGIEDVGLGKASRMQPVTGGIDGAAMLDVR